MYKIQFNEDKNNYIPVTEKELDSFYNALDRIAKYEFDYFGTEPLVLSENAGNINITAIPGRYHNKGGVVITKTTPKRVRKFEMEWIDLFYAHGWTEAEIEVREENRLASA